MNELCDAIITHHGVIGIRYDVIINVKKKISHNTGFTRCANHVIKLLFFSTDSLVLGEHNHWCKNTLFEESLRIPMMMKVPGVTTGGYGYNTTKLVEAVDAYPTIVKAATGSDLSKCNVNNPVAAKECGEGDSLYGLIAEPDLSTWKTEVYSQVERNGNVRIDVCFCILDIMRML